MRYKILHVFSEQQQIDCDTSNSGCNGGTVGNSFNHLYDYGGLELTSTYGPYLASKSYCKFNSAQAVAKLNFYYVISSDENYMQSYLYNYGPLAVSINAAPLQYYTGGIINLNASYCPNSIDDLDHAVNIVGYGTDSSTGFNYWIVRNSWGSSWGENGYFRIIRGYSVCGINQYVLNAVIA